MTNYPYFVKIKARLGVKKGGNSEMKATDLVNIHLLKWLNYWEEEWANKASINIDYELRSTLLIILFLIGLVILIVPMFSLGLWHAIKWCFQSRRQVKGEEYETKEKAT